MQSKRILSVILTAVLLLALTLPAATAESVILRSYTKGQGYQYLTFGQYFTAEDGGVEPILWRVLSVSEGKALLWSERVLDASPYLANDTAKDDRAGIAVEYEDSTVREFLTKEFQYSAFTEQQRDALVDEGTGPVFILTQEDLTNTLYGFKNGWSEPDVNRYASATPYAEKATYTGDDGHCNYWVATCSGTSIRLVHYIGSLGEGNCFRTNVGIRVAVWVDTSLLTFDGGKGTIEKPYLAE